MYSSGTPYKTTDSADFVVAAGSNIEAIPPFKSVTIYQDYDKRESIFRGWKLPPLEFEDTTTLKHWYNVPGSGWQQKIAGNDYMVESFGTATFDELKSIRTELVAVVETTDKLMLKIKCGRITSTGFPRIALVLDPTGGGTNYYYQSIGWTQQATPLFLGLPIPKTTYDNPQEIEMEIDGIPADGNIYVIFYVTVGVGNSFFVSECKLQFTPGDTNSYPASETTTTIINANNNQILRQYNQGFSDSPETTNEFAVYRAIAKVDGTYTENWRLNGAGDAKTLRGWLENWSDATDSPFRFVGRIYGSSVFYYSVNLTEYFDKVFVWEDVTLDLRSWTWDGSAIELRGVFLDGETQSAQRGIGTGLAVEQIDPGETGGGTGTVSQMTINYPLIDETGAQTIDIDNDYGVTEITLYSAAGATVKVGWTVGGEEIMRAKTATSIRRGYDLYVPTPAGENTIYVTITGTASVYITMTKYK